MSSFLYLNSISDYKSILVSAKDTAYTTSKVSGFHTNPYWHQAPPSRHYDSRVVLFPPLPSAITPSTEAPNVSPIQLELF
jgi:hypothetical protein